MSKTHHPSLLYSILAVKCPRCRTGNMFPTGPFSFSKPFDMHDRCPHCGEDLMPAPGYYYGAMFISYIFTGFFCLGFVMFFHWVLDWDMGSSFALLIAVCAIIFVYVFRLARSLWIALNTSFDSRKS